MTRCAHCKNPSHTSKDCPERRGEETPKQVGVQVGSKSDDSLRRIYYLIEIYGKLPTEANRRRIMQLIDQAQRALLDRIEAEARNYEVITRDTLAGYNTYAYQKAVPIEALSTIKASIKQEGGE